MKFSMLIILIVILLAAGWHSLNASPISSDFNDIGQSMDRIAGYSFDLSDVHQRSDNITQYSLKERFTEIKERIGEREFNKKAYFWSGFATAIAIPIAASITYLPFLGTFNSIYEYGYFDAHLYGWSFVFAISSGIGMAAIGTIPFAGPIISTATYIAAGIVMLTMPSFIPIGIGLIITGFALGSSVVLQHLYFAYVDRSKKMFSMDVLPYADSEMNPGFSVGVRFAL